ncbi:MAG: SgcJ/EcaC family oxidoreductase [Caulobacteraceae bacterium]|nr:SgcJ/EcaC family oxidoreductase [Caulobacteraceae bacterium]
MSGIVISGDTRGGVGPQPGRQGAQQKVAPGAYKAAVAGVLGKLTQAWNKGDAKAVGALFGKEADYVNVGGAMVSGADKIAAAHKAMFDATKGAQSAYRVIKLKPLGPDVVMAFLGQKITTKQGDKSGEMTTRPTMILRKIGNDWKIAAFQVTRVGPQVRAAAAKAAAAKAGAAKAGAAKAETKTDKPAAKKADKK